MDKKAEEGKVNVRSVQISLLIISQNVNLATYKTETCLYLSSNHECRKYMLKLLTKLYVV